MMHISNSQIHKVLELHTHKVNTIRPITGVVPSSHPDKLILSKQATEMQKIKQVIAKLPSVRDDVIADIKSRIQFGKYAVNEDELARRILTDIFQGRIK
ncbi:MAG: flagellar biosynthesis anti-sigma factor FlgM [Armatimonadota bacterium]|nr:flagellar biosynthesis anti-sigma factor FlgM [Armatimonadota bacterium]